MSRRWLQNWGSREAERRNRWPGDELVSINLSNTRAIEIGASAERVWRWLVQFGFGKAGFYSYELLERLVGIPVTNLEGIEPSMQQIVVGDEVLLHPKVPGIPVAMLEPERHICFGEQHGSKTATSGQGLVRSWSFYVSPVTANRCRLLVRGRVNDDEAVTAAATATGVLCFAITVPCGRPVAADEPSHCVMSSLGGCSAARAPAGLRRVPSLVS